MGRNSSRGVDATVAGVGCLAFLAYVVFWAVVIVIAIHFIAKAW